MKILVAGWFSFPNGHATAGDLLARDVAREWLDEAGYDYDVALAAPFTGGVDLRSAAPEAYSHVLFVCGPFGPGALEAELLERFGACRLVGLDLSLEAPLEEWNPFDFLAERDSTRAAHPDLVFRSREAAVPVVGLCLVEPHAGARTAEAEAAIHRLLATREAAVVNIDTRLDANATGLRSPAEVESLIARMDLLVTTRLHGMVLALKNGVPALVVDAIAGGGKISRQAGTIGWRAVFPVDRLSDRALQEAFDYCLTDRARSEARTCAAGADRRLEEIRLGVLHALSSDDGAEEARRRRRDAASAARAHLAPPAAPGGLTGLLRRVGDRILPRSAHGAAGSDAGSAH